MNNYQNLMEKGPNGSIHILHNLYPLMTTEYDCVGPGKNRNLLTRNIFGTQTKAKLCGSLVSQKGIQ